MSICAKMNRNDLFKLTELRVKVNCLSNYLANELTIACKSNDTKYQWQSTLGIGTYILDRNKPM